MLNCALTRRNCLRARATIRTPEAARKNERKRFRDRTCRALDSARMSPASEPRRGAARAPASAPESRGPRAGREVAAAAGAVALLAVGFAAVCRPKRALEPSPPPPRRVAVTVRTRPGGVIAFEAAAPVAAAEHAWPAARAAALGELTPGAQLTDVLEQEVLEKGRNRAVVRQAARWRVGPASGVARVTVRARVDDARQTACFELVNGSVDASSSSSYERKSSAEEKAPRLAAYGGVLGCEVGRLNAHTRVYLRGVAIVAPAPGIARGLATRFAARVLRKQTRRSIADIAANAEARARSGDKKNASA